MKKFKKISFRSLVVIATLVTLAALAHYLIFPEQTRCILIDYTGFKKEGSLYFDPASSPQKIDSLKALIQQARMRNAGLWGQSTADPKFIYCATDEAFKKYGNSNGAPATTHFKLGTYIVLSNEGIDLDIIAHELGHAELAKRIGFYVWTFKLPVWFNEGLAMQNDYRGHFSEDSFRVLSDDYNDMPDMSKLKSPSQFYGVDAKTLRLNFMAARHVVRNWYTREKLDKMVADLRSGKPFEVAYGQ